MGNFLDKLFGKNEPIKIYTIVELKDLNKNDLEEIVNKVQMRNPPNKSFHAFSSPKINTALSFNYKILGNRFENSIEKQKLILDYEHNIKKLKLELEAEEISSDDFNLKSENIKNQLLTKVWDISNTPDEIVKKLFELGLVSSKQKDICLSNKKENDELKNNNEKMLEQEYYYIDYIIENQ